MPAHSARRLFWAGSLATLTAVLADLSYYRVTKACGEEYLIPLTDNGSKLAPMPAATILVTILAAGLAATLFFSLLLHISRSPVTVFLSVAVTALIISFGGPFSLPAAALQTKILLSGMHIIAAVGITAGIIFLSRSRSRLMY